MHWSSGRGHCVTKKWMISGVICFYYFPLYKGNYCTVPMEHLATFIASTFLCFPKNRQRMGYLLWILISKLANVCYPPTTMHQ